MKKEYSHALKRTYLIISILSCYQKDTPHNKSKPTSCSPKITEKQAKKTNFQAGFLGTKLEEFGSKVEMNSLGVKK